MQEPVPWPSSLIQFDDYYDVLYFIGARAFEFFFYKNVFLSENTQFIDKKTFFFCISADDGIKTSFYFLARKVVRKGQ